MPDIGQFIYMYIFFIYFIRKCLFVNRNSKSRVGICPRYWPSVDNPSKPLGYKPEESDNKKVF